MGTTKMNMTSNQELSILVLFPTRSLQLLQGRTSNRIGIGAIPLHRPLPDHPLFPRLRKTLKLYGKHRLHREATIVGSILSPD
jgi:hypothetical protein